MPTLQQSPHRASGHVLHPISGIGWALLLGCPSAGAVLMAINEERTGNRNQAWTVIGVLVLSDLAITAALLLLPVNIPSFPVWIGAFAGAFSWARTSQRERIESHRARGGRVASPWIGVGVGLTFMAVRVGLIFAWIMLTPEPTTP